jgi:SAM-dependent methyltransferase
MEQYQMDQNTSAAFALMAEKLNKEFGSLHSKTGLDYGCEYGRSTQYFANLGAKMVGVDKCQIAVSAARELNPGLEFRLTNELGPMRFDFAVSSFCHAMISSKEEMIEANRLVRRQLTKDSPFIILTYNAAIWSEGYHGVKLNGHIPTIGSKIKVSKGTSMGHMTKEYYFWPPGKYWESLQESGFKILSDNLIGKKSGIMPFELITSIAT